MIKENENIINGNYKVTTKQRMLIELSDLIEYQLTKTSNIITEGYKYCPECDEYYREKFWETETKTERRSICTFQSLANGEDDIRKYKNCSVTYAICPMGHKIEEKVNW